MRQLSLLVAAAVAHQTVDDNKDGVGHSHDGTLCTSTSGEPMVLSSKTGVPRAGSCPSCLHEGIPEPGVALTQGSPPQPKPPPQVERTSDRSLDRSIQAFAAKGR